MRADGFYWIRNEGGGIEVAEWDESAGLWFTTKAGQVNPEKVEVVAARLELYASDRLLGRRPV